MYYRDKLRYLVDPTICQKLLPTFRIAGCPALAQNHYRARHNAGLKCSHFTLLKHYKLVNKIPPWHSAIVPKPEVKNAQVSILWDVPTHTAECRIQATSHQGNRPDVTVFDKQAQEILVVEFSCPWVTNRIKKDEEKMAKHQQVREELKARNPNYTVKQINVIMDVLGGVSMTLGKQLTAVIGPQETKRTIRSMQKAVLAHSVRIKNLFKIQST